ncbi:MAG: response regulator [Thermodesulfobacteriota bacterium]|nr:response regulator [Thermodesulfobacteriota bacterium]
MKKERILIVEDEFVTAMEIEESLKDLGYAVTDIVNSGEKALSAVESSAVDLVLMDIKLKGDIDGVEAAGRIRREFDVPVIYLTALADEPIRERAKITEPYGYIMKPFENRELHINIEIALYKHRMEKELLRLNKLESLGIFAGGIAHDFNNLLAAIVGNIQVARLTLQNMSDSRLVDSAMNRLDAAEKASMQAKHLTQRLLTFSRGGVPVNKTASLSSLLHDVVDFSLSGSNVICELSIAPHLWYIDGDSVEIGQVIQNLIANADQAMPSGGLLKISAENIIISEKDGLPLKPGRYVKLIFIDEGPGIPRHHLSRIFDPYFSTKEKGPDKGTGLGLAIAHSIIVQNHNGYIRVTSEPGNGAQFFVYLPASEQRRFTSADVDGTGSNASGHLPHGRVLVMDDSASLREMTVSALRQVGYESEFVPDGNKAIEVYRKARESGNGFDAVILDLTIPGGLGAKETLEQLFEVDKGVKAVVSSGYPDDEILNDYQRFGFCGAIAKPYNVTELLKLMKDLIG